MGYSLSENLITKTGKKYSLYYNYFTNKGCFIDNKLSDIIEDNSSLQTIEECASADDIDSLLQKGIIYKSKKEYLKLDYAPQFCAKADSLRAQPISLRTVYFHITQQCNLRCSYCYNRDNLNHERNLPFDKVCVVLTELKNAGVSNIVLTGGEALLYSEIEKTCLTIKDMGFDLCLLTNGVYLADKPTVIECADSIIISHDTFDKAKNRRKGLNLTKLRENLLRIDRSQRGKISIRSVVVGEDRDWKKIKKFCAEEGFSFMAVPFIPNLNMEREYFPSDSNLDEFVTDVSISDLHPAVCGAGRNEIAVNYDGNIYPCQVLVRIEFAMANILGEGWQEEMENPHGLTELYERNVTKMDGCKTCHYRYLCGGGCPAQAYNMYRRFDRAPEPTCRLLRKKADMALSRALVEYEKNNR